MENPQEVFGGLMMLGLVLVTFCIVVFWVGFPLFMFFSLQRLNKTAFETRAELHRCFRELQELNGFFNNRNVKIGDEYVTDPLPK